MLKSLVLFWKSMFGQVDRMSYPLPTHQHIFSLYNQGQHNISTIQGNKIMQSPLRQLNNLHCNHSLRGQIAVLLQLIYLICQLTKPKKIGSSAPHSSNLLFNGIYSSSTFFIKFQHCAPISIYLSTVCLYNDLFTSLFI